jgi:transposase
MMPARLFISPAQAREIEELRKQNKNKNVDRRLRVLLMHASGRGREEIASQTEYTVTYISKIVAKYVDNGISAIADNNYRGNRRNMSLEEETIFLDRFREQAEDGQIIEVSEIKRAYEEAIGRSIENSHGQIYRVLERHGWRKVMPRSKHPNKASEEEIEASKKLTLSSRK